MFEIGSSLRAARERQELSLGEIERDTKIRARYLAALEEECFDKLPGEAYVRGFLRTYARRLGLEDQRFVDEYDSRFAEPEPAPFPSTEVRRVSRPRELWTAVAIAATLAVLLGGVLAWRLGASGNPAASHAPVPTPTRTTRPQSRTAPAVQRKPAAAKLVLTAARGDCWLSVRSGWKFGPVLYEAVLSQGSSVRFARPRLWLRLGAPWNLDARIDGKRVEGLPTHTGDVIVTSAGLRLLERA